LWFMAIWVGSVLDWANEPLADGLGLVRPAGAGMDPACVSGACAAEEFCVPRTAVDPPRAADIWLAAALDDTAGGVMRLTVGRENALAVGRAPGLAFAPNWLSRVGLTFTRFSD